MTLTRQILIAMLAALLLGSLTRTLLQLPGLPDALHWLLNDLLSTGLIELGGQIFPRQSEIAGGAAGAGVADLRGQPAAGPERFRPHGPENPVVISGHHGAGDQSGVAAGHRAATGQWGEPGYPGQLQSAAGRPLLDVLIGIFPTNPVAADERRQYAADYRVCPC